LAKVDEAMREIERARANKKEEEHRAKLRARQAVEEEANFWRKVRYHNQLAKSYARAARYHEELCDALVEDGKYER
jgi:hypothetical protein